MSDLVNSYFKRFYPPASLLQEIDTSEWSDAVKRGRAEGYDWKFPRMVCADGFSMSVQAGWGAYCTPRELWADSYGTAEIGFPSCSQPALTEYAEDPERPTETVYGYVPIDVIEQVVIAHGGLRSEFCLPDMESQL